MSATSYLDGQTQTYVPSTAARTKSFTRGGVLSATEIQTNNRRQLDVRFPNEQYKNPTRRVSFGDDYRYLSAAIRSYMSRR